MFRQPLRNFLLGFLLNFCLKIFLVASKHFKVDIEPYTDKPSGYKTLSPLKDPLPVVEEKRVKKDFKSILSEARAKGNSISPVRRIKPLNVDVDECPVCGAPAAYLCSFGKDPEGYQKLQCKVCKHQWAPEKPVPKKKYPTYRCPFCGYALWKNFLIFKCRNDNCPKWVKQHRRYRFRAFDFDPEKLKCASLTNAPVNLAKSHFGPFLIAQAVNLYISLGLSLRQAAFAIKQFWEVRVSYETIQSWVVSLAAYLAPLVKLFPLPLSGIVVIDVVMLKLLLLFLRKSLTGMVSVSLFSSLIRLLSMILRFRLLTLFSVLYTSSPCNWVYS